jgi:hypothetical protein
MKNLSCKNNLDIFSQIINPIQNYKIKGDINPEHEFKAIYLEKLSERSNKIPKKKIKTIIIPSPTPITSEINTNFTPIKNQNPLKDIKEKSILIDSSDSDISNEKINRSLDKNSYFLNQIVEKGYEIENIELTQRQKKAFKLKDNNPFIYSFRSLHPFSMFYNTKYEKLIKKNNELELPAPNFIKKEEWCKSVDMSLDSIMAGLSIKDDLGIVIIDPVMRKKFSGLISDIIFQLLKVPFGHHISLNVKIFEPKTVLERYMSIFSYINIFLLPAYDPKIKPYDRFKSVITTLVSGMHIACQQLKPFNPFLGETFQGELPNGAKIYVENATHKPLVARFLIIYKKKYEISGFWDLSVKAQSLGSEMIINQKGPIYFKFPELDECITCHIPCVKAVNATSQTNRALLFFGNMTFVDIKNKFKAVIKYNYNKEIFHEIKGCTMNYEFPPGYKYIFDKEWDYGNNFIIEKEEISLKKSFRKKNKINENFKVIDIIKGSFFNQLIIGEEVVCDISKVNPEFIKPVKHCIPSDGRYREDLIWLFRSYYGSQNEEEEEIYRNISMEWKVMMEEFNRWERKNRAIYKEKNKIK